VTLRACEDVGGPDLRQQAVGLSEDVVDVTMSEAQP